MCEIKERRREIENWALRRKKLEILVGSDILTNLEENGDLKVSFAGDDFIPRMHDIGKTFNYSRC